VPPIDPVVYFKMLMIGFLENLPSERAIAARCGDSPMLRRFLGYDLAEETPHHSSFTVLRQRLSEQIYQAVFDVILDGLRRHGLLRGKNLGIDSSVMEANASLRGLENRNTGEAYWEYVKRLAGQVGVDTEDVAAVRRFDKKRSGRKTSNYPATAIQRIYFERYSRVERVAGGTPKRESEVSFKDHFSRQAMDYAKFRPQYPRALFEFIAANSPGEQMALDCATGSGQAAVALAEFFPRVTAIDASAQQIEKAQPNERVEYRVAPAEASGLSASSCDVITVGQALHWLRLDDFYAEAKRVLKPGGLLAAWTYGHLRVSPEVDAVVRCYHDEIVGPFWPPERKTVGSAYRDLPFPFDEIETPQFQIEVHWSREHFFGYLRTWSATQRFLVANGRDPVDAIAGCLAKEWNDSNAKRRVIWPLTIRAGRA
jgi:ubiquinone/menaquinone biosynthesis C-methylase UbiE